MYTFLYTHLAGGKNKQNIGNIKNLESMKPLVALAKLKETADQYGFASEKYLTERKQYIASYGDRGLHELKLETKTYRTNPELLDDYIRNNDFSFPEEKEEVSGNLFVRRAKTGIKNREDIFYLTIPEIKSFDLQPVNLPEKKRAIENSKQVPEYSRLVFDERILDKQINGSCKLLSADCLYGIGTSSGWVFLIKNATAIVSEKGSLLSHTAIITREQFVELYTPLEKILDYSMVKLVYSGNQLVAFFISIPNYKNAICRLNFPNLLRILHVKRKPKEYVLLYMGVDHRHLGLGSALSQVIKEELQTKQASAIGALIHEGKVSDTYYKTLYTDRYQYVLYKKNL